MFFFLMMRRPPRSTLFPSTARFRCVAREARAAARLGHPGIVALYELASDEHDVYLVSELVRGRTLAELEKERADRKSTRLNSSHANISYAVFCLKKKITSTPSSLSP